MNVYAADASGWQPSGFEPTGTPPNRKQGLGGGAKLAFIALLVLAGVSWVADAGQAIGLEVTFHSETPVLSLFASLVFWTANPASLAVLTLILFPHRNGLLIAVAVAALYFVLSGISTLIYVVETGQLFALSRLLGPLLVLAASILGLIAWSTQSNAVQRSPLWIAAVVAVALPLAFGGFASQIVAFISFEYFQVTPALIASQIPRLLFSIGVLALAILASIETFWSRLAAAIIAGLLFLVEFIRGIGSFFVETTDNIAPFAILYSLGAAAAGAVLLVAALRTRREQSGLAPGYAPPRGQ